MKQIGVWWAKLAINNIIQVLVGVLMIVSIFYASESFRIHGWEYIIDPNYVLDDTERSVRMFMVFFSVIFLFQSIYNIHIAIRFNKTSKQWLIYTFGFLTWLFTPGLVYHGIKQGYFKQFKTHLTTERTEGLQISHIHVINSFKYHLRKDKLFKNTILAYATFLSTLIGLIIILIPKNNFSGIAFLSFEVLTFFTQWSNILCFVFMFLFLLFHRKMAFRQNRLISYVASYIFVVGVVFWSVLLPFYNQKHAVLAQPLRVFSHVWLHTTTPIMIVIFTIRCYFTNYVMPQRDITTYCLKGCIFPAAFAIYAYVLPFTMHYSVYGPLTNLNDDMFNPAGKQMGYWWMIFAAIICTCLFVGVLLGFWKINKIVAGKNKSLGNVYANQESFTKLSQEITIEKC